MLALSNGLIAKTTLRYDYAGRDFCNLASCDVFLLPISASGLLNTVLMSIHRKSPSAKPSVTMRLIESIASKH